MTTPPNIGERAIERVLDALRAGGHQVTTRGGHAQASCPLHEDRKPSLSIDQPGDRVLLNCFSGRGCTEREIAEALGLRYDELWDVPAQDCEKCGRLTLPDETGRYVHPICAGKAAAPRRTTSTKPKKRSLGPLPRRLNVAEVEVIDPAEVVDTYDHISADGEVVAESVRAEGRHRVGGVESTFKEIRQRYTDGKGGWQWSKPEGLREPLWHLPQVTAAITAGDPIWLAEGHKDAIALIGAGVVATTSITTSAFRTAGNAEQLSGAHVTVVCDRDTAGYRRGLDVAAALENVAASVRVVLPAPTSPKADAHDHLMAGHSLDEFVEVTVDQLAALHTLSEIAAAIDDITVAADEARAQMRRRTTAQATTANSTTGAAMKAVAEAERFAARWAEQAAKRFAIAEQLRQDLDGGHVDSDSVAAIDQRLAEAHSTALEAFDIAGTDPAQAVTPLSIDAPTHGPEEDPDDGDSDDDAKVVTLATGGERFRPEHALPSIGRAEWRYDTRDETRGVYLFTTLSGADPGRWQMMAPLPHVICRIPRRDGEFRRQATDYRIAASSDGTSPITVDHQGVHTGAWANQLGIPLSDDPKVISQAGTAIRMLAAIAPEIEAVVTIAEDTGRITMPAEPPTGYLECADTPVDDALDRWREIISLVTPKQALVLAASAFAPFLRACDAKSHVITLSGGPQQGKSTTNIAAAAIWGRPFDSSVYKSWNASPQALPRMLGALRIMPHFRDEAGLASFSAEQWGRFIYTVTEGNTRDTPDRMGGHQSTRPWWGILFSTGNGEMTRGLGAGAFQGVPRRVIELAGPFTESREAARRIHPEGAVSTGLVATSYGHLGAQIAEHITAEQARAFRAEASTMLTVPEGADDIAEYLYSHLAGALIVDRLLGTSLLDPATAAAQDYLDTWQPAQTEADRVLELITDSIDAEPSRWPTRAEYGEHLQPMTTEGDPDRVRISQAGVARDPLGVRMDDDPHAVWVLSGGWKELIETTEINSRVACQQLEGRKILQRTAGARKNGEFAVAQRIRPDGRRSRVYMLQLPNDADPTTPEPSTQPDPEPPLFTGSDPAPVTGSSPACHGSVTGNVTGPISTLTTGVTGVTGSAATASHDAGARETNSQIDPVKPTITCKALDGRTYRKAWLRGPGKCLDCGAPCSTLIDGVVLHPGCFEKRATVNAPAKPAQQPQQAPRPVTTPAASKPVKTPRSGRDQRWRSPAAVLTADTLHLPGETHRWDATHLGDLAMLTDERTGYQLGCGGGTDRLPDPGQIWLEAGALDRLGLPTRIDWPENVDPADWSKTVAQILSQFDEHPMLTKALAAGWELRGDHLRPWTRLVHPELLPRGAHIVFRPWENVAASPITETDDPAQLVANLDDFAAALSVPYVIAPTTTGLRLIDRCRPPRRDHHDDLGAPKNRRAVVRGEAAELPGFLRDKEDQRFSSIEGDWYWYRTWEHTERSQRGNLTDSERGRRYVWGFDRGASYLAPWGSIELGLEGLQHHTGDAAAWDGKEKPGYFLVDDWTWENWALPDPGLAATARVDNGRRWVTVHTLRQLKAHGITPTVHEAYTWDVTSRYLDSAGQILRTAREHSANPAVTATVKALYTATVGKLGERDGRPNYHLWRPDWRHHIVAASRTGILHTLSGILDKSGVAPLAVDHDAVFFASDEADPAKAWPGDPKKLGTSPGSWKPIGRGDLAAWGPKHLVDATPTTGARGFKVFRYGDAVADLTAEGF